MFLILCISLKKGGEDSQYAIQADIQKIKSENDGLKKNLMQVYNMVSKSRAAPPAYSAPPQINQVAPREAHMPSSTAEDTADGKPYT